MKKNKAFSMIDLVIIVSLLGILAATAVPAFVRLRGRALQSEAKQNLSAIFVAYQSYFNDYNTFPSAVTITIGTVTQTCLSVAGWAPKGQIRYNYNCMACEIFSPSVADSPCTIAPANATTANQQSFTVSACGNVDNDTTTDEWTIDESKHLRNILNDVRQ